MRGVVAPEGLLEKPVEAQLVARGEVQLDAAHLRFG